MKFCRIVCVFLSAVSLFACLAFTAFAADEATPDVMKELSKLKINGEDFSVEKHLPTVEREDGVGLIAVVESGFDSLISSSEYNLFIYVYNPSGQVIEDDEFNSIQVGFNNDCKIYDIVGVKILSRSQDYKFLKLAVRSTVTYGAKSQCYKEQESADARVYNIVSLRFMIKGDRKTSGVSKMFVYTGREADNNLSCVSKDLASLEVELYDTNWISPNAGERADKTKVTVYDHYEIHSVYFKVPAKYWDTYEELYSIYAAYDAVHLTPIILTKQNGVDFDTAELRNTKNAILNGLTLTESADPQYSLCWDAWANIFVGGDDTRHVYTDSSQLKYDAKWEKLLTPPGDPAVFLEYDVVEHNSLVYYFESLDSNFDYLTGDPQLAVVSSEELKTYFDKRYATLDDKTKLYTDYIRNQEIDIDNEFKASGIYKMQTYNESLLSQSAIESIFNTFAVEQNSHLYDDFETEASHIQVIKDPRNYVNITSGEVASTCNDLFISRADFGKFSKICKEAYEEDCYVVLLRLGFKDYRCQLLSDSPMYGYETGDYIGLVIDKWAYRNVSLAQLVFSKNDQQYVIPVVSNVVDSFGDLNAYPDGAVNNAGEFFGNVGFVMSSWFRELTNSFEVIFAILGVFVLLFAVFMVINLFKRNTVKIKHEYPDDHHKRE